MQPSLGRIAAHLTDSDSQVSPDLVSLINSNINPPTPVTEHDVYIRAMYLVSDEINSYGGRFPADEHPRLASLLIDSPVLVGHRKDTLPIGRTFHAICTERDNQNWVKTYFYWLKSSEGAETLRENIDGGIYKECSIGFTYLLPECSICGQDIRTCRHEPMQPYPVSGQEQSCHFNYRQVERVLETSLVYRGATPDTAVSRELQITKLLPDPSLRSSFKIAITQLADLPPADSYLITPSYPGLDCCLLPLPDRWSLSRLDGQPVSFPLPSITLTPDRNPSPLRGRLVAYRGRERCPLPLLEKNLAGQQSPVSRVVLYLYPNSIDDPPQFDFSAHPFIKPIRHRYAGADQLLDAAAVMATRDGVEIFPLDCSGAISSAYHYRDIALRASRSGYSLQPIRNSDHWLLELRLNGRLSRYLLRQFNLNRFKQGMRFVADWVDKDFKPVCVKSEEVSGAVTTMRHADRGYMADLSSPLATTLAIRPIKLERRCRYLIHGLKNSIPMKSDLSTDSIPAPRTTFSPGRHLMHNTPSLPHLAACPSDRQQVV